MRLAGFALFSKHHDILFHDRVKVCLPISEDFRKKEQFFKNYIAKRLANFIFKDSDLPVYGPDIILAIGPGGLGPPSDPG